MSAQQMSMNLVTCFELFTQVHTLLRLFLFWESSLPYLGPGIDRQTRNTAYLVMV